MRFWHCIKQLWAPFASNPGRRSTPAVCYYLLLSILPAATILFLVSSGSGLFLTHLFAFLQSLIPEPFHEPIMDYLAVYLQNKTLLPYSVLLALWSSAKGIQAITTGLEASFRSCSQKGFLRKRLQAILHYGIVLTALILVISFMILGEALLQYLSIHKTRLVSITIKLTPMLSITLLFCLLFRRIPDVTPSWRHCIAGAVFSSSGWIVLSVLFSVYFTAFANFDTHAELATPIPILLLWLKLCMDFLFMGAVVTAELTADTYHPLQYIKKALKR